VGEKKEISTQHGGGKTSRPSPLKPESEKKKETTPPQKEKTKKSLCSCARIPDRRGERKKRLRGERKTARSGEKKKKPSAVRSDRETKGKRTASGARAPGRKEKKAYRRRSSPRSTDEKPNRNLKRKKEGKGGSTGLRPRTKDVIHSGKKKGHLTDDTGKKGR